MQYKAEYATLNKSAGTNTCQFIVLHHTWTGEGTIRGVLNTLTKGAVSCHYVVDTNGDVYKIGNDKDILWHAGESAWGNLKNMNSCSIWIEVIWPLKNGGFTDDQRKSVETLIKELAQKYAIPKENILRHKDISPRRKTDIADSFWNVYWKSWEEFKNNLFTNKPIMAKTKYTDLKNNVVAELAAKGLKPVFGTFEGDKPLTEQETKELIEIATARVRLNNNLK